MEKRLIREAYYMEMDKLKELYVQAVSNGWIKES